MTRILGGGQDRRLPGMTDIFLFLPLLPVSGKNL